MVRNNNRDKEVTSFPSDDPAPIPPSSPFYLHPSDNPGTILVTKLLNGSNFINWNRSMKIALLAKNKLCFVDGSVSRLIDSLDPNQSQWDRCNGMVVSWLRNVIVLQIRSSLMYLESFQIWVDLKERFSHGNIAQVYESKQ